MTRRPAPKPLTPSQIEAAAFVRDVLTLAAGPALQCTDEDFEQAVGTLYAHAALEGRGESTAAILAIVRAVQHRRQRVRAAG